MSALSDEVQTGWREPKTYIQKSRSPGRWVLLFFLCVFPPCLIYLQFPKNNHPVVILVLTSLWIFFALVNFWGAFFGPSWNVCLTKEHVSKSDGWPRKRSYYNEIESCNLYRDSASEAGFSRLKFTVKNRRRWFGSGPVTEIAVPAEVNLGQVLHILRRQGIEVVEKQPTSA